MTHCNLLSRFLKHGFLACLLLSVGLGAEPKLTRIIGTGDSIPGSPDLTAGFADRHAQIDQGHAVFFADHEQFGVDVPSNSLLYWDGETITKIADDDTPVPGKPGRTLMFNDLTSPQTLSLDVVGPNVTVVFWASYSSDGEYAIYKWDPKVGSIQPMIVPSANIQGVRQGTFKDGTLIFPTHGKPGTLSILRSDGSFEELVGPGDPVPGIEGATFDFIQPIGFQFNGSRVAVTANMIPTSLSGEWEILINQGPSFRPLYTVTNRADNPNDYPSSGILAISHRFQELGAVGVGRGFQNGPPKAILYQALPGSAFTPIASVGDIVGGYTFSNFGDMRVLGRSVVFGATLQDASFEQMSGIYQRGVPGTGTLIDSQMMIDGKRLASVSLSGRDNDGTVLFGAVFEDNTSALYTLQAGTVSFDEWTRDQFPDAGGDQSIVGPMADPEGDGVANIVEFVLGGQGNVIDPGAVAPSVVQPAPNTPVEFEFRRRRCLANNVTVTPQSSSTLVGDWQSGAGVIEEVSVTADDDTAFERVRLRYIGEGGDVYIRILVSTTG